ncbi:ATP-binding protein [Saccharospirillum mangrovi]|uniref:ATP-binding protein n=1 Tax=Saccharospirillum mangrovi TaxID=2161747 RepID=UPI000D372E61|nr:ATP-binding protein [Saccharospirillum mangrovi]
MRIRLRYQVLAVILLANALLTMAIVIANNQAFSASFAAYQQAVQAKRLAPLIEALAEEHALEGGWQHIDSMRWSNLVKPFLFGRRDGEPSGRRSFDNPRFPGPPLQLRDANGATIAGPPFLAEFSTWLPIENTNGERIGELGIPTSLRLTGEFDRVFADQQRRQLRWIALIALLLSVAVALPFAAVLTRPIGRLQRATHRLASGDYDTQIAVSGSDELADLARDFNHLARTLAQNLNARQRWIADISHELRTPIAVLRAELEAIQDGVREPNAETLASLYQEIERLSALVEDLHELSLSDAGALSYRREPLELGHLVEDVLSQHSAAFERAGLTLDYRPSETPLLIDADSHRLTQLLSNLAQNSLRYTDAPGQVKVRLSRQGPWAQLEWSDSSPGVPAEALPKLFDRLYRVEESRNRASGGSGLGLAIVHNVVTAHQGQVEAKPSPLGGLTLIVQLPLRKS